METMVKEALIKQFVTEEDFDHLNKIQQVKKEAEHRKKDFTDRIAKAYKPEEARAILHKHIESLPWKK